MSAWINAIPVGIGLGFTAAEYIGYKLTHRKPVVKMVDPSYAPGRGTKRMRPDPEMTLDEQGAQGGYDQQTTYNIKTGRRRTKKHIVNVLAKSDALSRTLFWKLLPAQFTGTNGQLYLSHNIFVNPTVTRLPLYMFNLDRLQLGGVGEGAAHRCFFNKTTGYIGWQPISGQAADGTAAATPQVLRQAPDFPIIPAKDLYFSNYDIKLCLYGCTAKHTTFDIMLVSFDLEEIPPANDNNILNGGSALADGVEHQTFWQSQLRNVLSHPCAIDVKYGQSSKMKVHKAARYEVGPTATDQSDPNPHHVIVKWFHQRNRKTNMRLTGVNSATDVQRIDELINAQENRTDESGTVGLLQETPRVRDRLYLMVKANDYVINNAADTNALAASFDVSWTNTYYVNV